MAALEAGDGDQHEQYGFSVALDGDIAVVGAPSADAGPSFTAGAAYVYEHQPDGSWLETQKLVAPDSAPFDRFGHAVALAGGRALIGSFTDDSPLGADHGSAYVFERQPGGSWSPVAKLLAADASSGDVFGSAVALAGDRALIGARGGDGAAPGSGAAYVFEREPGGAWVQVQKLAPAEGAQDDVFGTSVALAEERALVGAQWHAGALPLSGAAHEFRPGLEADLDAVSLQSGGTQSLSLHGGLGQGGKTYLLLGSLSGTAPGIPVDAVVLPLNLDAYLQLTCSSRARRRSRTRSASSDRTRRRRRRSRCPRGRARPWPA